MKQYWPLLIPLTVIVAPGALLWALTIFAFVLMAWMLLVLIAGL